MIARDVMTDSPTAVRETARLGDAFEILHNLDIRHLPVVNADHEVVGMLSDRDLGNGPPPSRAMAAIVGPSHFRRDTPVSRVMSGDVVTTGPENDVVEVADLMVENRIGAVPVVDPEGRLLGIVSYVDLLRALGHARD